MGDDDGDWAVDLSDNKYPSLVFPLKRSLHFMGDLLMELVVIFHVSIVFLSIAMTTVI